jgi:Trk-type K+ transport system membrane component
MLTFTSFFAFFYKGATSYQENLYMQDFFSSEKISGLLSFAFKIVVVTFSIEIIGAVLIYINLPDKFIIQDQIFFSIFHSISAFCNAGFSTISEGLYNHSLRFNYNILNIVSILIIIGGLGYQVMFQLFKYLKVKIISLHKRYIIKNPNYKLTIGIVGLNTRIVFFSTIILLVIGTISFFIFEYENSLAEHTSIYGKVVTAFFGGVTPRTAGYNSVNYSQLLDVTIIFTIFLMWIGASPASTGGGIKTTTFTVLILNIYATIRGKNRIELRTKEINNESKNRAFSVVTLSLLILGLSTTLIATFETGLSFKSIVFETFSAYSTVGLSLGITDKLTDMSKIVLIFIMTIGRIGAFNILIGLLKRGHNLKYKYPEESILIN